MKQLILLLLLPLSLIAQEDATIIKEKMTPKQHSILQAKEMRLKLDLTKVQEERIQNVLEEHLKVRPKRPKNREQLSSEEKFKMRLAHLEHLESFQENLKAILTSAQYEMWKKRQRKSQMAKLEMKKNRATRKHKIQRLRGPRNWN